MAGSTILATLLEVSVTLLRIVLTPLTCMVFCLFWAIARIQRYIFDVRADGLRSATWRIRNKASCDRESKKLLEAWSASTTSKVLFVTIEVSLRNNQTPELAEIAISRWSPAGPRIETLLWAIESTESEIRQYDTNPALVFVQDAARTIQVDELSMYLEDTFQIFRDQYERLYLAGYRIKNTLSLLEKAWSPTQDMVIIDTERVWRAEHHNITELSFKDCIETIPELREYSSSLQDIGNRARLGIQLVKIEIESIAKRRQIGEASKQQA